MQPFSPKTIHPSPWRSGLNAVLLIVGLTAGFIVFSRRGEPVHVGTASKPEAAAVAAAVPVLSAEEVLQSLPVVAEPSQFGEVLEKSVSEVRRLPASAPVWTNLGDVLAQGQRDTADVAYFGHAEKAYQFALGLDAKGVDAMAGLAWVFGGRHQFDLSILWAEKALGLEPEHLAAHGIIGDAAVERGDYETAFTHYQKMMDLRPDLSSLSRGAHLLWLTGQQTRAVMLMGQAIASGGPYAENVAWCRARLAMMHFHDGAIEAAAGALRPALENGSRNVHVLLAAGRIAAARAEYETAVMHYEAAHAAVPSIEALAALGDIFAVRGDAASAEKYYARVEELHRSHRETGVHDHLEMARFYADHDRSLAEGLRLALEHGQTGNPFEADALAWLYFKNGDQVKAIEWIKVALKANLPDAAVHYHAGCIAAAAGDRVAAENHLQQALSKNPHFSFLLASDATRRLTEFGNAAPEVPTAVPATEKTADAMLQLR